MINEVDNLSIKSFNNYTGPSCGFKKKNVIFGYNGQGKSSLAIGIVNSYMGDDGAKSDKCRFYNRDYVKNNLLLRDGDGAMKGIVADFGHATDIEKQIADEQVKLIDTNAIQLNINSLEDDIWAVIDDIYDKKKGSSKIQRKSKSDMDSLMRLYEKDASVALRIIPERNELVQCRGDDSFEKSLDALRSLNVQYLIVIDRSRVDRVCHIMSIAYSTEDMPQKVFDWIEEGLLLHGDNCKECKFCGGHISIEKIKNDFERRRRQDVQSAVMELRDVQNRMRKCCSSIEYVVDNKNRFCTNVDGIETNIKNLSILKTELESYINRVENKIDHMNAPDNIEVAKLQLCINRIQDNYRSIITAVHQRERDLNKQIANQDLLVKGSIGVEIIDSNLIKAKVKEWKTQKRVLSSAQLSNDKVTQRIAELCSQKHATADFAKFITEIFESLGIDLKITVLENGSYRICNSRDDEVIGIDNISEGERNMLALLFFYYELFDDSEQKHFKEDIDLIVVDDPISSMDYANRIYVIEMVIKILELSQPQVFVFTHSWSDFVDMTYGKCDKDGDKSTDYRFLQVLKRNGESCIEKISTKDSPYRHMFREVYDLSKKDPHDMSECDIYHMPNAMRKILEEFLSFKVVNNQPTRANVKNVSLALYGEYPLDARRETRIKEFLDVCNVLSHRGERSQNEIHCAARFLMERIADRDSDHFHAMTAKPPL